MPDQEHVRLLWADAEREDTANAYSAELLEELYGGAIKVMSGILRMQKYLRFSAPIEEWVRKGQYR